MGYRLTWADLPGQDPGLGCHLADVPRTLLPREAKAWELVPSDARASGLVLRYGTEDSRGVRRWRLNSP